MREKKQRMEKNAIQSEIGVKEIEKGRGNEQMEQTIQSTPPSNYYSNKVDTLRLTHMNRM